MPPRSVCLNVFTASLGNGINFGKEKEPGVEVSEVDKMEGVGGPVAERWRHDSVQGSPNDSIATTLAYTEPITTSENTSPIATADINITTLPLNIGCSLSRKAAHDLTQASGTGFYQNPTGPRAQSVDSPGMLPATCYTCAQPPAPSLSLLRCSRCKNAYYCSKNCQKAAWKQHKYDCERAGTASNSSPYSELHTPDVSTPASPVADDLAASQHDESRGESTPADVPCADRLSEGPGSECVAPTSDVQ
ncbi:hypothetical protein K458DRAFT_421183 [Lentithecium fluviatile CBS 122367]|uniref:MYND-type domain-containing protein n=1 Tax=Lentithecium fluviatile CBS 122367 TaxID=1168545 RepID=A0A6G1IRH3_9PLEO|nr:hypothetical protein K458DRAFT_421183 [Lentithecium fluviatile CBS 122367]